MVVTWARRLLLGFRRHWALVALSFVPVPITAAMGIAPWMMVAMILSVAFCVVATSVWAGGLGRRLVRHQQAIDAERGRRYVRVRSDREPVSNWDIVVLGLLIWAFAIVPASLARQFTDPLHILIIAMFFVFLGGVAGPVRWIVHRLPIRVYDGKSVEFRKLEAWRPLTFLSAGSGLLAMLVVSGGLVEGDWVSDLSLIFAFMTAGGLLFILPIMLGAVVYVSLFAARDEEALLAAIEWEWGDIDLRTAAQSPGEPQVTSERVVHGAEHTDPT